MDNTKNDEELAPAADPKRERPEMNGIVCTLEGCRPGGLSNVDTTPSDRGNAYPQAKEPQRDERDRRRSESPLVQAPDAELIDTTGRSLEEVEQAVLLFLRAKISNGKEAKA